MTRMSSPKRHGRHRLTNGEAFFVFLSLLIDIIPMVSQNTAIRAKGYLQK